MTLHRDPEQWALPGLEQRFKNLQPASSQNFLGLVFANSVLDQSARHVSRVGMIGHLPAEEPEYASTANQIRTAPLWGLRTRNRLGCLHLRRRQPSHRRMDLFAER